MPRRGIVQVQQAPHLACNEAGANARITPDHPGSSKRKTNMSLLDLAHRGSGVTGRLADAFARLSEARARRSLYRQTVRELRGLGDRELADLGLNRAMIHSVARDSVAATRG